MNDDPEDCCLALRIWHWIESTADDAQQLNWALQLQLQLKVPIAQKMV